MPEQSATADAINAAIQDPVPFISEAPDTSVRLLKGWNGYKDAAVREMTGADEEYLSSLETRSTLAYPDYVSSMLKRTVVSIGTLDVAKNQQVIDELIIGDRDILFIAVVKATYGKVRTYHLSCPHCKEEADLSVDLDADFPVLGTEEDAEGDTRKAQRNTLTARAFEFQLVRPSGGKSRFHPGQPSAWRLTSSTRLSVAVSGRVTAFVAGVVRRCRLFERRLPSTG